MDSNEVKENRIYRNKPQLIAAAANPRLLAVKGGRRLGKTVGIVAPRLKNAMEEMPRSAGFFGGKSFRKVLDHLLPEVIAGWRMLGWIENEDFVVCRTPPKSWDRPIVCPRSFEHFITAKNGSGIHLISFDHSSTSNGLATDHGALDESKQLDPVRVDSELLKTMSGHRSMKNDNGVYWGELPEHTSLTITQDGYYGKKDFRWIDRYAENATEYKDILRIILLQNELQKNYSFALQQYIWELQREATLFMTPSTLENLAVLGIDYFKNAYKNSNLLEFRASILNEDVKEVEGGFYTYLDESIHAYSDKNNYSRIETIGMDAYRAGINKDCRLDNDWRANEEMKISIDYGSTWNWMVVMQKYGDTYWCIKNFFVESPRKYEDMVRDFCAYYKPHVQKVVRLFDDPSGHREKTDTTESDIDRVIDILQQNGWVVIRGNDHNAYLSHHIKYRIVNHILDMRPERDGRFAKFQINSNNAYETLWSMAKARIKMGHKDFIKDKSDEKNRFIEQWKATHLSDCVDNILGFENEYLLDDNGPKFSF